MTIVAYLMDYTLSVLCGGNKNALGRRLDFRRGDINRMLKRLNEGAHSIRVTEAVLKVLYREQCSLDQLLAGYSGTYSEVPGESVRLACEDMARILREQMANSRRAASQKMRVLQSAESFMEQLERAFCSDLCRMRRGCDKDCPCKRFAEFVEWIQKELEEDAGKVTCDGGGVASPAPSSTNEERSLPKQVDKKFAVERGTRLPL